MFPLLSDVRERLHAVGENADRLTLQGMLKVLETKGTALSSLRWIDKPRSFADQIPETNWYTRLALQLRSDELDQNRRSRCWGSNGIPSRRFRTLNQHNRSVSLDGVQTTETDSLRKSQRSRRVNRRDLIQRRPGTRRQREGRRPNRLLQATTFSCLLFEREGSKLSPGMGNPSKLSSQPPSSDKLQTETE